MAEQERPRFSMEEEKKTFTSLSNTFNPNSNQHNSDEQNESDVEQEGFQSTFIGSFRGPGFSDLLRHGQEDNQELGKVTLNIPGSSIESTWDSRSIDKGNAEEDSNVSFDVHDTSKDSVSSEPIGSLYPHIQRDKSPSAAPSQTSDSSSLFPELKNSHGLILSGRSNEVTNQIPDDEEEILLPLPPLSEFSILAPTRDNSGLPFSTEPGAESTFMENANLQRWDHFDNQFDINLGKGFSFPDIQSSLSAETAETLDTKPRDKTRISPFENYISNDTPVETESNIHGAESKAPGDRKADGDNLDVAHILEALAGAAAGSLLMKKFLDKDSDDESSSSRITDDATKLQVPSQQNVDSSSSSVQDDHSNSEDGLTFDEGAGVGVGFKSISKSSESHEPLESESMDFEIERPSYTAAEKGKQVVRDSLQDSEMDDYPAIDFPPIKSLTDMDLGAVGAIGGGLLSMMGSSTAPKKDEHGVNKDLGVVGNTLVSILSSSTASAAKSNRDNNDLGMIGDTLVSMLSSSANTKAKSYTKPRNEEHRPQIYPDPPAEPWATKDLNSKLSQRRSPASATKTETSEHDPYLAFMSSARKPTEAQPAPAGKKSLLSDFPDTASKKVSAPAPRSVTLPSDPSKAPVLRGYYELPSIKKIDQWKSVNSLAPNSFRRLLINVMALIVSRIVMKGRVYSYTRSANNFENLPLTPSQRTLLGLDSVISKVPGAVPIFKKPTAPPHNLTERPMMSTYVSPSNGVFAPTKTSFQKPSVASTEFELKDAATILNKSMSRSFNQSYVKDKADLSRLMRNIEAREELQAEWKTPDTDPAKRAFGLHGSFGAPQGSLQTGVDMSTPDQLANLNSRGPVSRYQPALRTTLSKDHTSKTDLQKDGLYVVGYGKVLKNLKVSEQQLDRWAFNLRKWLWNKVVKHVCSEMEIVDAELAKEGLSYLDCKSATMFYASVPLPQNTVNGSASTTAAQAPAAAPLTSSLAWGAASIASTRLPSAFSTTQQQQQPQLPTSLQDLEARYGQSRIVKQRIYLESYLAVPGFANRKYVVERLQAMGPLLSHFIWDSHGVAWDGGKKTWSSDLPSDSQIIMHLFMTYIDSAMPSQPSQVYDRFPFTYKHYVPMDNKPDPTTALQIKQTSKYPPDYSLVVEGSMWEVVPKRLNVWYTMVLFIYMVMKESGGYIGQINIGTQMIGLGDVVEGYDL
ncbi:hypothetical protein BGZ76_001657 [Entomortierella beljakovae]|nr:hypothetical protein BGZ76_001657 [Entomortierella beljakovae]